MGKIIVIDNEGVSREYDRGFVFGICHPSLDPTAETHNIEVDYIRIDACSRELLELQKIVDRAIERDAKKRLGEIMQEGEFPNFMAFMLADALRGSKKL
jgi:hypothetical protein